MDFKKKQKTTSTSVQPAKDESAILAEIKQLEDSLGDNPTSDQLDKLGTLYSDISRYDDAIKYFEHSLAIDKKMGKASTSLTKLYNKKRAEAAQANNSEQVAYWLAKSQEMLQLSKDILRGNL